MAASPDSAKEDRELEILLRQVLRLVDITRDIERNRDDALWKANGKTIDYVFDENIFELFIDPKDMREVSATFHGAAWSPPHGDGARNRAAIAAQAALITSEYLMSGQLPGQRDEAIHMTEWHMWELKQRIDHYIERFRHQDGSGHGGGMASISRHPYLIDDLQYFQQRGGRWTAEAIDRFVVARKTAHTLAEDQFVEPMEQVRRIVSPLRDRLVPLTDRFEVPFPDWAILAHNAVQWRARLKAEAERRVPVRRRTFDNDARSLAFMQWAAVKAQEAGSRVVMVTGDAVLFDAYRRWHSGLSPEDDAFQQPFCLRRPVQYAPIFNMNDGVGDISEARELFALTEQAVEIALLPFNLAQLGTDGLRRNLVDRNREAFALKLADHHPLTTDPSLAFFREKLTPTWRAESRGNLQNLTMLWQRTERAAIGSMYDSIKLRMSENQTSAAYRADAGADDLGPVLTNFVNDLLDQIVVDSIHLWAPLASRFIDAKIEAGLREPGPRARPPILIRLDVGGRDVPEDLSDFIDRLATNLPLAKRFLSLTEKVSSQPEVLFALAATLALALGSWTHAERFADLALKAARVGRQQGRLDQNYVAEFEYLLAVSIRFRIAETAPARNGSGHRAVMKSRARALETLDICLAEHRKPFDGSSLQPLRLMRALAERAALNLFYFGACVCSPHLQPSLQPAVEALSSAEEDLDSCLAMESDLLRPGGLDGARLRLLERISRHYVANRAACVVAHVILLGEALPCLDPAFSERVMTLLDAERSTLPPIVILELYAYLHLTGARPLESLDEISRYILEPAFNRSLPLDRDLFDRIWKGLAARVAAAN